MNRRQMRAGATLRATAALCLAVVAATSFVGVRPAIATPDAPATPANGGAQQGDAPPPIIDMHLHAFTATAQGPPPLSICPRTPFIAWDPRTSWAETFLGSMKQPTCDAPLVSPMTDDELMRQTVEVLERRNIIAVTSGTPALLDRWRAEARERIIAGLEFRLDPRAPTPERVRELFESGRIAALAEVTNQYLGIEPDDPRFEPYLALAEELDMPVGIHIGTGPPGAPYLPGNGNYRARMHSPLSLEEPLLQHPGLRVWVMHAGWPMLDDTLALLWAHPQVYVEVGIIDWGLPLAEFHRYLRTLVEAGFGKRVMFGSDQMVWPGAIEVAIDAIESADFLTTEQKRDILYNNAARFLRLEESPGR